MWKISTLLWLCSIVKTSISKMLTTTVRCFYYDNVRKMNKIQCKFVENAKNGFIKEQKGCDGYKRNEFYVEAFYLYNALYLFIY